MNRLRLQLIAVLVLAIVVPLLLAAFAARELFRRSLDPLRAPGLAESAEAGLAVARAAIDGEKAAWEESLRAGAPLDTLTREEITALRLHQRPAAGPGAGVAPALLRHPELVLRDSVALLVAQVRGEGGEPVWVARALPDSLARRARSIEQGARLLATLRREHGALLQGLQTTFLAVYAGFAALVLALGLSWIARLTRPLAELAGGIDRAAGGDLAVRVPERGSAEVSGLMRRFNSMAAQLDVQQQELARLERLAAWRGMARALAHEIKNPLTPIQLAAEQMRDAYRGDDPRFRRLLDEGTAIITEEVSGLREWVSEFSQFARLPEVRLAHVACRELVEELQGLYGERALRARVTEGAETLRCDRDLLKRALVNLVDNARAAQSGIGRDASVELEIERHRYGTTAIHVRDRGPGIPPERRRRVFEPDYTTKSGGMGLGLAIVETIVQQHGGAIRIEDTPGGGATFVITLPSPVESNGASA